jgi:glycine oxidase
VSRVTFGRDGYIVPRAGRTIAGSTMEAAGFDARTTDDAIAALRAMARAVCPPLDAAREVGRWSGLRPITPDLRPIIGRDPDRPGVIYACGHSRNGVLLAPLTGDCVAALVAGAEPAHDLTPFAAARFAPDDAD